jgi:hypothetical protein
MSIFDISTVFEPDLNECTGRTLVLEVIFMFALIPDFKVVKINIKTGF